jgi:gluconate 2-dehydrogenase gamma chain
MKRRIFLQVSGATALVPAVTSAVPQKATAPQRPASADGGSGGSGYLFFNAPEAAFIEAAVERLIPPDELGPGALQANVPTYLDRQLQGAWGAGERLYRSGPWPPGTPSQGYQLPFTPAELFRTALRAIREDLQRSGSAPFEKLPGPQQDAYLTALQTQQKDLGGVPSKVFFESLLAMTVEGYFCDPVYGGNKDMAAWAMVGFPGAYGSYYERVGQYGVPFDRAPRSLAQTPSGHGVVNPNIPAKAPVRAGHKGH